VPFLALWIALASIGSAAVLLVVKRPARAWEELAGLGPLITPWRPMSARWRSRGARQVRRRDLRGLFASPRSGLAQAFETIQDAVAMAPDGSTPDRASSAQSLETGPGSDDSESLEPLLGLTSRILRHPGFLVVMVSALVSLATWRSLLAGLVSADGQGFTGGQLLPVSTGASSLFHGWLDGWHGAGLGNALEPAPYLPVLAAGAWVVEHLPMIAAPASSVGTSIAWLLVAAIPLSAWTAYLGARVATRARWPRAWAALAWASLATLTTAQASGRLGAVVAHILLPLVVAGFVCAARRSTGVALTFGAALALGVTGAFNPALGAFGAFAALLLLVFGRGATRLRALVLLLVPAGLLGPSLLQLVDDPRLLLTGPGLTLWQGAAAAPWQLALLHPGGPGSYPVLLSAPIVVAGVVAMVRRGTASRAMTMLALLAVTGLAAKAPRGGLTSTVPSMPAVAADQAGGPLGSRLLEMTTDAGTIGYRLVGSEPGAVVRDLTGAVPPPSPLLAAAVKIAVSDSDAASANAARDALADQGVGFVAFRGAPTEPLVRRLDATAGMTRLSANGGLILWRVLPRNSAVSSSRLRLEDAQGRPLRSIPVTGAHGQTSVWVGGATLFATSPNAVTPTAATPGAGTPGAATPGAVTPKEATAGGLERRLVVAEPAGWAEQARVTFAGHVLAVVSSAGQPSYLLPSQAGRLTITLAPTYQAWRWGQLGLLLAVLFLAAPFGSARARRTS